MLQKLLLFAALLSYFTTSSRPSVHPHRGNGLTPYTPGSFDYKVTSSDEAILAKGEPVLVQIPGATPNEAAKCMCIQDVLCDAGNVWSSVTNFGKYVGKVPKVKECSVYCTEDKKAGKLKTRTAKVKMVVGVVPGYKYECYYDHTLHPSKSSVVWSLDYDKYSDFDEVQGHWHVKSLSPTRTRVFYAADLKLRGAVPGPVMKFLSKVALKESTCWVKKDSEAAFGKNGPVKEHFMLP
jgi:hypothetical protein